MSPENGGLSTPVTPVQVNQCPVVDSDIEELLKTQPHVYHNKTTAIFKLLFFSILGVTFFFIPVINGDTPLLYSINTLTDLFGNGLSVAAIVICGVVLCASIFYTVTKNAFLGKYMAKDGISSKVMYVLAVVFGIMVYFKVGPAWVIHPDSGGLALSIAAGILLTVALAGFVVTFIASYGMLQIVGVFMEPLMRPVYKLPGYAAVDACTSIACSAAVDVFMCNKIYMNKLYTKRDAATVASNFTICSLGFFVFLCKVADITEYYGLVALTAFTISFIIPIITVRIPPLSRISNEYVDGSPWQGDAAIDHSRSIFRRAWDAAVECADDASPKLVLDGLVESMFFAAKVCTYVLSVATIALAIGTFTPVFTWIGMPFIPILQLLGIPNAVTVAPAMLVGITEISLPALIIAGKGVADAAAFFVVVLSTVQVIFFTESANAIMESDIPLNFGKLILIFFIRTIIAMPIVAIAMHIFF